MPLRPSPHNASTGARAAAMDCVRKRKGAEDLHAKKLEKLPANEGKAIRE